MGNVYYYTEKAGYCQHLTIKNFNFFKKLLRFISGKDYSCLIAVSALIFTARFAG